MDSMDEFNKDYQEFMAGSGKYSFLAPDPKHEREPLDTTITLKVTAKQRASWQAAADREGISISEWLRIHADKAAGAVCR